MSPSAKIMVLTFLETPLRLFLYTLIQKRHEKV